MMTQSIEQWLRKVAYRTGEFTLRSGQKSSEYMDVKDAILHADSMLLAYAVGSKINRRCNIVAGVELGGALLAQLVAKVKLSPTLVVRKADKGYGANETHGVIGMANLPACQYGDSRDLLDVWLVEDVITTGGAVIAALDRLMLCSRLRIAGVVAAVDREQGGIEAITSHLFKYYTNEVIPVLAVTTLKAVREASI